MGWGTFCSWCFCAERREVGGGGWCVLRRIWCGLAGGWVRWLYGIIQLFVFRSNGSCELAPFGARLGTYSVSFCMSFG